MTCSIPQYFVWAQLGPQLAPLPHNGVAMRYGNGKLTIVESHSRRCTHHTVIISIIFFFTESRL